MSKSTKSVRGPRVIRQADPRRDLQELLRAKLRNPRIVLVCVKR